MEPARERSAEDLVPWTPRLWSWFFRMPEFSEVPLRTQALVHWRANLRMLRSAPSVLWSLLISVAPAIGLMLLFWYFNPWIKSLGDPLPTVLTIVLVALWLPIQHLCFIYVLNRFYAPFVRRELVAMGLPMCPACGHRLVGASVARCSECGTRLDSTKF